jgi:hypothetical protein
MLQQPQEDIREGTVRLNERQMSGGGSVQGREKGKVWCHVLAGNTKIQLKQFVTGHLGAKCFRKGSSTYLRGGF